MISEFLALREESRTTPPIQGAWFMEKVPGTE